MTVTIFTLLVLAAILAGHIYFLLSLRKKNIQNSQLDTLFIQKINHGDANE
ncbi:hypothetical protein [Paenibacillus koleovorans]|uniref:hypothetical protein n=1 Tax=Paenibacillus koleovorans TaxID=121608 RepID=UPI0013E33D78|nr:hypothetical protein [Paenibacillus koleovorans]